MTLELLPHTPSVYDEFFQLSAGKEQSGPRQSQQARSSEEEVNITARQQQVLK